MVVKRKVSKERYLIAAVLTLLIFIPGVLLGMVMDDARIRSLQDESRVQELDFRSHQLNYLYISNLQNDNKSCVALKANLEKSIKELSRSLESFEDYKQDSKLSDKNYDTLSRRYLLDNLNYWLLSKKTKDICGYDTVNVLYFFRDDCEICPDQGIILTYFKKKLDDKLLVFPINTQTSEDELMVDVLLTTYNITEYPSLVIDDITYRGIMSTEEMHGILCGKYGLSGSECETLV